MNQETEFKAMLTREQYDLVSETFHFLEAKKQENFYYRDDSGTIEPGECTVRIRQKNGICKLQVKVHRGAENGMTTSDEYEADISEIPESICTEELPVRLCEKNIRLTLDGSLVTYRSVFEGDNYELCLDRNEYADIVDYEVELEFSGEAPADVLEKLNSIGIVFAGECVGKYARFRAAKEAKR